MSLLRSTAGFQWVQLLVLTAVHIIVDMYAGMLPAILPVVREDFALTLTAGIIMLTVLNLSANVFQVIVGHLRQYRRTMFFLPLGLVFIASLCFLPVVKNFHGAYGIILLLSFSTGFGIAVIHPESLRAAYSLDRIPPSIITSIYLTGGVIGFAVGAWLGAAAVHRFGLQGLYFFIIPPLPS